MSTSIHCASCNRWLMRADAMTNGVLRCKGCGVFNVINLESGRLEVRPRDGTVGVSA